LFLLVTLSHHRLHPDIWERRVLDVAWLNATSSSDSTRTASSKVPSIYCQSPSLESVMRDVEAQIGTPQSSEASFATKGLKLRDQEQPWVYIRRGVDHPFAVDGRHIRSSSSLSLPSTSGSSDWHPSRAYLVEPRPLTPRAGLQHDILFLKPPSVPVLRFSDKLDSRRTVSPPF